MENEYREAIRRAKQEAEHARRARMRLLDAANHDLRQPLQALFFFTAVLARRVRGRSRAVVTELERSLDSLSGVLDSLTDLARLDAGTVVPRPGVVPVQAVFDEVERVFRPLAAAKGLRLSVVGSSALVRSDQALLTRIVASLVSNAIRFTPRGGVVVGCRTSGGMLRIEVWDSGIGIEDDELPAIFEDFYQVANPHRDPRDGLGLGLPVARRIARLLAGHALTVRSVPRRGSVFAVEAPRAAAAISRSRLPEDFGLSLAAPRAAAWQLRPGS